MKIKYWFLVYTVAMLLVALIGYQFVKSEDVRRDMTYYNSKMNTAQQIIADADYVVTEEVRAKVQAESGCVFLLLSDKNYDAEINELIKERAVIYDYIEDDTIIGQMAWKEEGDIYQNNINSVRNMAACIWLVVLVAGNILLLFVYRHMIRPFNELKGFSAHIAKGNLDIALPIYKQNAFGAFTESFDLMREELKKSREREYEANRSKKELVAELSHDIKTPVATIKAACEVMDVTLSDAKTLEKVHLIEAKADTIDSLISNLFHATMEELEMLKVEPQAESSTQIMDIFNEVGHKDKLNIVNSVPECLVYMDVLRLEQVINNIVNNSVKYANTDIEIEFMESDGGIRIKIRDFGEGVPTEECAALTEKFYRGSNSKGRDGSGLGLYLSKYFMEHMNGTLELYCENGFVVELFLSKVS